MHEFKRMLTLFNSKEKEIDLLFKRFEWFSLETLGKDEGNEMKFSFIGEEEAYILKLWLK